MPQEIKFSEDDILRLEQPPPTFLCSVDANIYGIEFIKYCIRYLYDIMFYDTLTQLYLYQ